MSQKNSTGKKKQSMLQGRRIAARGLSLALTFLIVIEGFILAICIGVMITQLRDTDYNPFAKGYMHYRVQDGDYGYLVREHYSSGMDYYEKNHDKEAAALAAYADAAMQYRAWSEAGMTAKADAAKARMEAAAAEVGLYAPELEAIRKKAGLE